MSSEGETCVFPDIHSSSMPNIPWKKENKESEWYSNLRGGSKVGSQKCRYINIIHYSQILTGNLRNGRGCSNDVP